eukprot:3069668-Pyramimonas_sp.AAC.1
MRRALPRSSDAHVRNVRRRFALGEPGQYAWQSAAQTQNAEATLQDRLCSARGVNCHARLRSSLDATVRLPP